MNTLLASKVLANNIHLVITMMLKYGLIVEIEQDEVKTNLLQEQLQSSSNLDIFLVPALLPPTLVDPLLFQDAIWQDVQQYESSYFVFNTNADLSSLESITSSQLKRDCFLPRGLMERLIGKAVKRSQMTSIANIAQIPHLYQNYAVLSYGNQKFRLICFSDINCIRLDVEGFHPLPVYDRICEQIAKCLKESTVSLFFISAVRLGTSLESQDGFTLLNLHAVKEIQESGILLKVNGFPTLCRRYISANYNSWLVNTDLLDYYDVFISHRWDKYDDVVSDMLYDSLLGHTLGLEKRAVRVFYDKVRLKEGEQFQVAFGKALINSDIFVPILCTSALQRMLTHDSSKEDNVLIEWILALECIGNQRQANERRRKIYPVVFGKRNDDGSVGNIFAEGLMDQLPTTVPTVSIEVVKRLFAANMMSSSPSLDNRTVRSVVYDLMKFKGMLCWEVPENTYVRASSHRIVKLLAYEHDVAGGFSNWGCLSLCSFL